MLSCFLRHYLHIYWNHFIGSIHRFLWQPAKSFYTPRSWGRECPWPFWDGVGGGCGVLLCDIIPSVQLCWYWLIYSAVVWPSATYCAIVFSNFYSPAQNSGHSVWLIIDMVIYVTFVMYWNGSQCVATLLRQHCLNMCLCLYKHLWFCVTVILSRKCAHILVLAACF